MTSYSHSKLSTFEQCPYKFKLRYIDKIKPEVEITIEIHLGKVVHASLEWLYNQILKKKIPTAEELVEHYCRKWEIDWKEGILIQNRNLTKQDYFNKGISFLLNYYLKHAPFDDNTLETEKKISFRIGKHKLFGFIDRLSYDKKSKEYVIHDYKTSGTLPTKEKITSDRQLSIYSMAIQELLGGKKRVLLVWHYLNFNKRIFIRKTEQELENLKKEILKLIEKIETEKNFAPVRSKLCNWCEYKKYCPEFGGEIPKENPQTEKEKYPTIQKYFMD